MINIGQSSSFMHFLGRRVLRPLCAIALLLSVVALVGCSSSDGNRSEPTPTPTTPTVSSIAIWEADGDAPLKALELNVGAVKNLVARATYSDGSTKKVDATWKSSDTSVVTVDSGTTTGVKAGTAKVTASFGGKETTIKATVKSIDLVSIVIKKYDGSSTVAVNGKINAKVLVASDNGNVELPEKYSAKFEAWGSYSDGTTSKVNVNWKSSSANVEFDNTYGSETIARGENVGSANITASTDKITSNEVKVQVTDDYLQDTIVKKNGEAISSLGLLVSDYATLEAYGKFSNGKVDPLLDAGWNANKDTVTVNAGKVVAKAVGDADVLATDPISGIAGKVSVVVTDGDIESIYITGGSVKIAEGASSSYGEGGSCRALAAMKDGQTVDITNVANMKSEDNKVATVCVDNGRVSVYGAGAGNTNIYCEYQGVTSNKLGVSVVGVKSIVFDPSTVSVAIGSYRYLEPTIVLKDGSTTYYANFVWTTEDSSIAMAVDRQVYGIKKGKTTIKASIGTVSGSCTVNVTDPPTVKSIELSDAAVTIYPEEGYYLESTALMSDGTEINITRDASWLSSDDKVATVAEGYVVGVSAGKAKITCTYGGKTSSACEVTVQGPATIESIEIEPDQLTLIQDQIREIYAKATMSDGSIQYLDSSECEWMSDKTSVATVSVTSDKRAVLHAVGPGTASITCKYGDKTSSACAVTVQSPATIESIAIYPGQVTLFQGQKQELSARAKMSDGTTEYLDSSECEWISDVTSVALVTVTSDKRAVLQAVGKGTASITCKYKGVTSAECTVMVSAKIDSISIVPSKLGLVKGSSDYVRVVATLADKSTISLSRYDVTWKTGESKIAEVEDGYVYGVGAGTTAVTCEYEGVTSSECTVTVKEVESVTMQENVAVEVGGRYELVHIDVKYKDGTSEEVDIRGAIAHTDDASVAVIDEVFVYGVGHGETDIWCTYGDVDSNKCRVKVYDTSKVTGIAIAGTMSVTRGERKPIGDITVSFEGSDDMTLPAYVAKWNTENKEVVDVWESSEYYEGYVVYGSSEGVANIWCTIDSTKSNDCTVTVEAP